MFNLEAYFPNVFRACCVAKHVTFPFREPCHYIIERPVTEGGGGGGGGGGQENERKEMLEIPCTQWDFNTTTFTSTLTSEVSGVDQGMSDAFFYRYVLMVRSSLFPAAFVPLGTMYM